MGEFHLNRGVAARTIAAAADAEDEVVVIETPQDTGASLCAFLDKAMELSESIEITPTEAAGPDAEADAG